MPLTRVLISAARELPKEQYTNFIPNLGDAPNRRQGLLRFSCVTGTKQKYKVKGNFRDWQCARRRGEVPQNMFCASGEMFNLPVRQS